MPIRDLVYVAFVVLMTCPLAAQSPDAAGGVQHGDVNLRFSRIYVHARKTGFGHEHAVVGELKSGTLRLTEPGPVSRNHGKLVFDMDSFDADGAQARRYVGLEGETDANTREQVNQNLLGKDVLDVEHYPTAEFEITSVKMLDQADRDGNQQLQMTGKFKLHGRSNEITIDATLTNEKGWHRIRGKFTIRQTEYGIKPFKKAFGAVGVADELTIFGDLLVAP